MTENLCPKCKTYNRPEARFCQQCGEALVPPEKEMRPGGTFRTLRQKVVNVIHRIDDELDAVFGGEKPAAPGPGPQTGSWAPPGGTPPAAGAPQGGAWGPPAGSPAAGAPQAGGRTAPGGPAAPPAGAPAGATIRTVSLVRENTYRQVGEKINNYAILKGWYFQRSNYYMACLAQCQDEEAIPSLGSERCRSCLEGFPPYLIRESLLRPAPFDDACKKSVIELSRSGPGLLKHIHIFAQRDRQYAVSEYPGDPWQSLAQLPLPVADLRQVAAWGLTLGQALLRMGEAGFIPSPLSPVDFFEPLVISKNNSAAFADLTLFEPVAPGTAAGPATRQVSFLAQVLYTLASGNRQYLQRAPEDLVDVPPGLRKVIYQARGGSFPSVEAFLDQLRPLLQPAAQSAVRSLRQNAGYRTDIGRKRDHNEDFVGKYSLVMQQTPETPEVGLYLVADGMGGHQAGEQASQEVVRHILGQIQEKVEELQKAPRLKRATLKLDQVMTVSEVLRGAIQRANQILFETRQALASDRGTTVTAALVVGETCAVANVGDSRTYLLRGPRFEQITKDHSLVASLVAAQMIRPEEVRSHPQRNQIFRTLGEKANVEVDTFERQLQAGDRLLMCSDGLWELVLDAEIEAIVRQAASPQAACDRLVEAANRAGGDDNISVIIVAIE